MTIVPVPGDANDNDPIKKLLDWIVNVGINGFSVLPAAKKVAEDHLSACGYDKDKAINSIITWRTAYAAGTGFVTGLGGLATLPITIPASLASSYALAANTAAAIASVRGLITKAGEKGVVNLMKLVPIVGGVVGAGFDGTFVNKCGNVAKNLFN